MRSFLFIFLVYTSLYSQSGLPSKHIRFPLTIVTAKAITDSFIAAQVGRQAFQKYFIFDSSKPYTNPPLFPRRSSAFNIYQYVQKSSVHIEYILRLFPKKPWYEHTYKVDLDGLGHIHHPHGLIRHLPNYNRLPSEWNFSLDSLEAIKIACANGLPQHFPAKASCETRLILNEFSVVWIVEARDKQRMLYQYIIDIPTRKLKYHRKLRPSADGSYYDVVD